MPSIDASQLPECGEESGSAQDVISARKCGNDDHPQQVLNLYHSLGKSVGGSSGQELPRLLIHREQRTCVFQYLPRDVLRRHWG